MSSIPLNRGLPGADTHPMTIARPDRAFFLISAACALAYVSLPHDGALYGRWYQLFPIAAVAATLIGVTLNRPRSRTPWYLVAVAGLFGIAADAVYAVNLERYGSVPFPSTADLLELASGVVLVAALLAMIRRQAPGRDWPSLVDAGILTVGVAIVAWTFVVQPRLTPDASGGETVVALSFPVLDLLLVSLAARMMLGPRLRSPAFAMVMVALLFQLVGDALYGVGSLHGWYRAGDPLDLLFVLSAVLFGTAALHPSMVELTEPNPEAEKRLSWRRLAVLSAATLMAPAMLAVAAVREASGELLVIVGAATTLSALVIVRLAGLVARHARAERREHALAEAATALVHAWTRDDIQHVAVDAALAIVDSEGTTVWLTLEDDEDGPRVVAQAGEGSDVSAGGVLTVVKLEVQGEARGEISVRSRAKLPRNARDGLETLAAQVALALEGAALAEDLHERQSAERFRSLVQNSSDVIALLSPDLTIRYHTPSVERVLGYGEEELVGGRLTDVLDADDMESFGVFFVDVCESPGVAMPRDLPLRRKDGDDVPAGERLQQPSRRSERRRGRRHGPRRDRPAKARGRARAPGVPRLAHRAREPRALRRSRHARARARHAPAEPRSPSSSSTSTTSRRSTTALAMRRATSSSSRSHAAWRARCGPTTRARGSAATSSRSWSRASRARAPRSPSRAASWTRWPRPPACSGRRSRRRRASGSRSARARSPRARSCAAPTWRCTAPRRTASRSSRSTSRRCTSES